LGISVVASGRFAQANKVDQQRLSVRDSSCLKNDRWIKEAIIPITLGDRIEGSDGAFAECKEAIAAYFKPAVSSTEEAVRLAQACPILANGAQLEVRPVADRLGYEMTLRSGRETPLPATSQRNNEALQLVLI
jgi:hypothetical protein